MMPRPPVRGGLRGPAQDLFPEDAKEYARELGLEDEESQITLLKNEGEKVGGVKEENWVPVAEGVRANIMNATSTVRNIRYPIAEQVSESATHIFHIDPVVEVTSDMRIQRGTVTWAVLAVAVRTEEATIYVEAKQL